MADETKKASSLSPRPTDPTADTGKVCSLSVCVRVCVLCLWVCVQGYTDTIQTSAISNNLPLIFISFFAVVR